MEKAAVFVVFFLLLGSSLLLMLNTRSKTRTNLWFGLFIFSAGVLGYFGTIMRYYILPVIDPTYVPLFILVKNIIATISYRFSPYFFLNASISFTDILSKKWQKRLNFILLIPIFILYTADFIILKYNIFPKYMHTISFSSSPLFIINTLWAIPSVIIGYVLYYQAYFVEKNRKAKTQKLLACVLNLLPLIVTFNTYIPRGPQYVSWKASFWLTLSFITLFLILLLRFSALGYKVIITQQQLDSSMRTAASGTLIFNHSVKNELAKINFGMTILKKEVRATGLQEIIETVSDSTNHLSEMVNRIKDQMQEIVLVSEYCSIMEIVEPALESIKDLTDNKKIEVVKDYDRNLIVFGDRCHLREVMVNVLRNAVEAISNQGKIEISHCIYRKYFKLIIKDNGHGISKENLARVFEPFFSTKKFGQNYGLGLSYCYNVMQKHGGKLEIESGEKTGTTVILTLPINKTDVRHYKV